MRLFDILRRGAASSPDKTAVTHGDRNMTYRELLNLSGRLRRYLMNSDIPAGSRVGVLMENSIEYIAAFFAVTGAGYVPVPLDTSLKPDKFRYILDDCDARILFIQKRYFRFLSKILDADTGVRLVITDHKISLDDIGVATALWDDAVTGGPEPYDELVADIDDVFPVENIRHDRLSDCAHELAAIFYTSGSTGTPKGVMLSHRNLVSNTVATVEYLNLTADDSILVILPFYYIYGNSLLLTHMVIGARTVIDNRFAFPQVILEAMVEQQVTGLSGVPSNFMILLNNPNFASATLPNLRYLTQAGGGMAPDVIRRVMTAFSDKQIFIMYGQTEASPRISYLPPEKLSDNVGSIGIPVPGVIIEITDDAGRPVPDGNVGEITVSGDCVMMGYWNQPEEQAEVLRDGRLFTGDLARRDENGMLFIVSRKKEIMKVGGNRVSAKEVEEKILEIDKILEIAVISVGDDILGEAIKAYVVLKDGQSVEAKEIQDFCKAGLAMHKVPKFVEFVDELPKYQSGKVNKQALTR